MNNMYRGHRSRIMAAFLAVLMLMTLAAPISAQQGTTEPANEEETQEQTAETTATPDDQPVVFKDVEDSYAKDAIARLASLHLISGIKEEQFYPQKPISRQDVAVLLSKVMGLQPIHTTKEALFEDVELDSPYAPYVYTLTQLEVLKGRPDNQLGAADPLTRQELAVLLTRLMKAGSIATTASSSPVSYEDFQEAADYARDAITTVTNQRWMMGANGSFRPLGNVTRAEAAMIAERVLDARYQQADNARFEVNHERLVVMAGSSERLTVKNADGTKLSFTPIFGFDRPELGMILPDGTFVAGPEAGAGNVTVTVGFRTVIIPVQITPAVVAAQPEEQMASAEPQATEAAEEPVQDAESTESAEAVETTPAEEDDLINIAPDSFSSVKTVGPPDNYFHQVEMQYPGPVGGLTAVSEEWTGYNRQYGRKVLVALPEGKAVERVNLTFQQRKTSGITLPDSLEVEVSQDGKSWSYAGKAVHDVPATEEKMLTRTLGVSLPQVEARYVRVTFPVKVFVFARQLEVWAKDAQAGKGDVVLLPPPKLTQPIDNGQTRRPVENMLLAYTGMHDDLGTWTKEDFLPMVGYLTQDGYMRDQMFDTVLLLPYQTMPATRESWTGYLNDLFRIDRQLDALNSAMREYNRLRGTLYSTPTKENVVLAIPYPNAAQMDFGKLPGEEKSLSFNAAGIGEEAAYQNRKKAVEWYFQELLKRWKKEDYSYLHLDGIYWFHELVEDSAPKERELIRSTASMVHDEALRFYWIPYFGSPGVEEWKSLYFDRAFLQPNYYSDKPVTIERIEGVLDAVQKYGMDIEIEGDHKMYNDPKFYQLYYNQLTATRNLGMDKDNVHAYYYGSKTLLTAVRSTDEAIRAIYEDTYKWMRGRYEPEELMEADAMP